MNMRLCFSPLFMVLTCLVCGTASENNFYVGLNAGVADQTGKFSIIDARLNPDVGITGAKNYLFTDDAASTYSLLAGYKLGADMAIEIGVADNADIEGVSRTVSTTGTAYEKVQTDYMYAALISVWPIKNGWALKRSFRFFSVGSWYTYHFQYVGVFSHCSVR